MGTGGETAASILLVAGPSGCGKSTLIGALRARQLAGSPLPEGAWAWPETCAKDIACGDLPMTAIQGGDGPGPKGHRPEGLIVHYGTTRVLAYGFADHCDDPAIKFVASAEGPVLAVTVACPREMLFAQFLERAVIRSDGMEPAQGSVARLKRVCVICATAPSACRASCCRACKSTGLRSTAPTGSFSSGPGAGKRISTGSRPRAAMSIARPQSLPPGLDGAPSFTLSTAPAFQADETNWRASA